MEKKISRNLYLNANVDNATSVDKALIAKADDADIGANGFLDQIAPSAVDFFIADIKGEGLLSRANLIGTNNNPLSHSELNGIVARLLGEQRFS